MVTLGDGAYSINNQTGSTYTLVLADASKLITMDYAGGSTITIPTNSSVAFPIGIRIRISQISGGSNNIFFSHTSVTVNSRSNFNAIESLGTGELIKIATDEWMLTGDLIEDN